MVGRNSLHSFSGTKDSPVDRLLAHFYCFVLFCFVLFCFVLFCLVLFKPVRVRRVPEGKPRRTGLGGGRHARE